MQPLLIVPSKDLIKSANIMPEELSEEIVGYKAMWVRYPVEQVDWLNKAPGRQVLWVWCSFRGKDTVVTQKQGNLFEFIKLLDKRVQQQKAAIAMLMYKLKIATSQHGEVLRQMKQIEDAMAAPAAEPEKK